jgi:hypothetical protein
LFDKPVFVFTTDIDWASEHCIQTLLTAMQERGVVPTAFATHASPVLAAANAAGNVNVGLHPNFLPGSTHGETHEEVLDHVFTLFPEARYFRAHAMVDDSHISMAMKARDILYDSNLCLYLQAGLVPLHHWTGIPRFPMFWADDIHWRRGGGFHLQPYEDLFFSPGLKIIGVHPFMFTLNLSDHETYTRLKPKISTLTNDEAEKLCSPGPGAQTFLLELIDAVHEKGFAFQTLDEVYNAYPKEGIV